MSIESTTGLQPQTSGLSAIDQAREPAWVREGSSEVQQAYTTALGFEEMLVQQLSQSLTETSGLGESSGEAGTEGSSEGGAASNELDSLMPQALAEGIAHSGGLGLAAQLTQEIDPSAAAQATVAGSGASAPAPSSAAAGADAGETSGGASA